MAHTSTNGFARRISDNSPVTECRVVMGSCFGWVPTNALVLTGLANIGLVGHTESPTDDP
jgi:hypothetical protein